MITLIEARNYRCLRSVSQPLGPFQLLVGPNATGKSTLLDVVRFLGRLVADGLQAAITERTFNVYDLTWRREGQGFELAVEASLPDHARNRLGAKYDTFRYEVAIKTTPGHMIAAERGFLKSPTDARHFGALGRQSVISDFFGDSVVQREEGCEKRLVISKAIARSSGNSINVCDRLFAETQEAERVSAQDFCFGPEKSTLANLPEDESIFPAATWFKRFLVRELTSYELDSRQLHAASPPALRKDLLSDAANLPWVVANFRESHPTRLRDWVAHLQIALPDLVDVNTVLREDDRHRYLMLEYADGLRVPSWSVSEGTLRLIALTLPAYLNEWHGMLLIEEPENGLHPLAIETAYQSLSSVYDGQVLMATHSPLLVRLAEPSEVLCFTKDEDGGTQIVSGDKHPRLTDWHGEVDLGTLFASGVLG